MIEEQEQAIILLLSDDELYEQAQEFMRGIAKQLPTTQVTGLLNVSMSSTYDQLQRFIKHQQERTTWRSGDDRIVIPDFYRRLSAKFESFKKYLPMITQARTQKLSREDEQDIIMALAREFIQHLLAQNAYMGATRAFTGLPQNTGSNQARPQEQTRDNRNNGNNRNTGGPSTQQRRG